MKLSEVSAKDAALYARLVYDGEEFDALPEERKRECERYLAGARAYVCGYTGLDPETCDLDDVAVAMLTVFAEMADNRQMTAQYTGQNPMVLSILNLHSTNLLPKQ